MKSIVRFLGLFLAVVSLTIVVSCSPQTSPTSSPSPSSPSNQGASTEHSVHGGKQININTAILSELDKLEAKLGIPALSHKIQASRPYGKTEELVSKNVITQEQYDQIKDLVTIEDIVLTGEAKDVDYMTKLGLMKGHLLVAGELLELGKPDQAEPHIGHPVEEIYADVEEQFRERNVKDFKAELIALQDLVKAGAKDMVKVKTDFQASMQAVDGAIAGIPATQRNSPGFVLQVMNGLLDTATAEYTASIADGKISQVIEYQDSRGFVIYAADLYKRVSSQVGKENPEANTAIQTDLAKLMQVWPSVEPPNTPILSSDDVAQRVKSLELSSQKVIKAA